MPLISHYNFILRIVSRLSAEFNNIWRFLPAKVWIRKLSGNKSIDKNTLKTKLESVLGTFDSSIKKKISVIEKQNIIKWADKTLKHEFDYLGSGWVKVDPIDWHTDFKSGFCWPKGKFYKKYVIVDLTNNADVKIPWELSRSHHLLWLGEAYMLTDDNKYAKEVVFQIDNWINENPLMHSINWTCAMDVAIRAVNWLYALNMIIDSNSVNNSFAQKVYHSLFEHLFFIYNNLEKQFPYSANHYASDISGLLFLSIFFKNDNKYAHKSLQFSLKEYYQEIRNQVLPSGVHFEKSTSYHRLMTELFLYSYLLLLRKKEIIPIDIHPRICSMISFVASYTMGNGLSPLVGDNDNGRFLPFYKYDFRDHRYLFKSGMEGCFLGKDLESIITEINLHKHCVSLYNDAGIAIIKNKDLYLLFSNTGLSRFPENNNSKEYCTHSHNDLLSFVLSIGETEFISDPGTYLYTSLPAKRNEFRSTKKHNTIVIDDIEQNNYTTNNLFTSSQDAITGLLSKKETSSEIFCSGNYTIKSNKNALFHERKFNISIKENKIIISDLIKYNGNHKASLYFHLAEGVSTFHKNDEISLKKDNKILKMHFKSNSIYDIKIVNDTISTSYSVLKNSKTIIVLLNFNDFFNFVTNIYI